MKKVVPFTAMGIPVLVGYIEYSNSYHFPKWEAYLSGIIMAAPFSLGLILSTTQIGKKFRFTTAVVIFVSALVRSTLLLRLKMWAVIPVSLVELYSIYSVFVRNKKS